MITALEYLVIAAAIGAAVFVVVVFVFGRGEQMAPLNPRTSPAELPDSEIAGDDVRRVKFAMALRGYRMSDVDWVLDRVSERLDDLQRENALLRGDHAGPATESATGEPVGPYGLGEPGPTAVPPGAAEQEAVAAGSGPTSNPASGDRR